MIIQRICEGEPLENESFKEVRGLTAPFGRISSANTLRTAFIGASILEKASFGVNVFPPALAQARAVRVPEGEENE